jgi:hypothetical protein
VEEGRSILVELAEVRVRIDTRTHRRFATTERRGKLGGS